MISTRGCVFPTGKNTLCDAPGFVRRNTDGCLCRYHYQRCHVQGCSRYGIPIGDSKRRCSEHMPVGMKQHRRTCNVKNCEQYARHSGRCFQHLPKRKCADETCPNICHTGRLCRRHAREARETPKAREQRELREQIIRRRQREQREQREVQRAKNAHT